MPIMPIVALLLVFLIIFSVIKICDYTDKLSDRKIEIRKLNKLYECLKCKKYHRKYQEIIKSKSNGTIVSSWDNYCPHCGNKNTITVNEEYEWTKYHQDCPALDKKKYKIYNNTLVEIDKKAYEMRSIEKFIEKNNLIK